MKWVIENQLARSSRPGYPSSPVAHQIVEGWVKNLLESGIRSVICLLTDEQLAFYEDSPGGLLGYYKSQGIRVVNIPIPDPAHYEKGWSILENKLSEIANQFYDLPKPVLIHCSAGMDRTGKAIRYILELEKNDHKKITPSE